MNKVIIMGRLAADPELRRTQSDLEVTSFTVAVNGMKKKDGTQDTNWIDCVAWRHNAEFICKYFGKGKQILLEGQLQTRNYEDKNGNKRKQVEVLVDHAEFCGDSQKQGSFGDWASQSANAFQMGSGDDVSEIAADDDLPF